MLINCAAYQDGRKLADIGRHEIKGYVSRPDCFVWVALSDPDEAELREMQEEFDLHGLAVEDAHHGHQRPKIDEYGDSVFAVLHTVQYENGELSVGELNEFVGSNYVLSVRNRSSRGFQEVRARSEREPELLRFGSGYVLYALMDAVVDRYFPVLDDLETRLEGLEEQIFGGRLARANIESLYDLRQKLVTLKHAAGPLLDASGKLHGGRVPQICAGTQDYYRDVYDHLIRVTDELDNDRELVAGTLATLAIAESVHRGQAIAIDTDAFLSAHTGPASAPLP